jgi:hypothetical protein
MGLGPRERRSLYAGRGLAKRLDQGGFVGSGRDADFQAGPVAERARNGLRQDDGASSRERLPLPQGPGRARRMDQDRVEGPRRRGAGLDRLIDRQRPRADAALQQRGEIPRRLQRAGNQRQPAPGRLRSQQPRQIGQGAACGPDLTEPMRPRRPGRRVPDGEDRQRAPGAQPCEGVDAVPAGEGQGRDAVQVDTGGQRADVEKGGDQRLEAESRQTGGGARGARLGAGDPDLADRRQDSVL